MRSILHVITPSARMFNNFVENNRDFLPYDRYRHVRSADQIRGLARYTTAVAFYGPWQSIPDAKVIEEEVKVREFQVISVDEDRWD